MEGAETTMCEWCGVHGLDAQGGGGGQRGGLSLSRIPGLERTWRMVSTCNSQHGQRERNLLLATRAYAIACGGVEARAECGERYLLLTPSAGLKAGGAVSRL